MSLSVDMKKFVASLCFILSSCSGSGDIASVDVCDLTSKDASGVKKVVSGIFSSDGIHSSSLKGKKCNKSISLRLERMAGSSEIATVRGNEFLTEVFSDFHGGAPKEYDVVVLGVLQTDWMSGDIYLSATEIVSYKVVQP